MSSRNLIPTFDRYRVELRLTKPARFPFEHGAVLRGLLSRALGRHDFPDGLIPFPCESGRVCFDRDAPYALGLTLVGATRSLAAELEAALRRFGATRPPGPPPILGGNFTLAGWKSLPAPDLGAEVEALRAAAGEGGVTLCLRSPLRLARPAELKRRGAGFLDRECFPPAFFLDRLWRRLFFLAHRRYPEADECRDLRPPLPGDLAARGDELVWSDLPVKGTRRKARPYTLGGVRGTVRLEGLDEAWLTVLAAGGYLHAGSSTAYGFGRYSLAGTPSGTDPLLAPARTLLDEVRSPAILERALAHVLAGDGDTADEGPEATGTTVEELARDLGSPAYRPRPLVGFVERKDGGGVRPLATPRLRDKLAQRAAVEVLTPALDTLLEDASFAYRRGFSRQGAARAIERAYAEGYRYVLDAGIRSFFDRVDWRILFAKLDALYPGEPLLELIRAWVESPVDFDGRRIVRDRGLPPGCPISPLLAHLYLDTFDEELLDQGFRLVRFADDFVVLAKDPEAASAARHRG